MLQLVFPPPIAMLLSIKEMEVRKIAFAETWQPGEIDFSDAGVRQAGPLKAEGVAELLPHSGEEVRVHGKVETTLETECDRCLGTRNVSGSRVVRSVLQAGRPGGDCRRGGHRRRRGGDGVLRIARPGAGRYPEGAVVVAAPDAARLQRNLQRNLPGVRRESQ